MPSLTDVFRGKHPAQSFESLLEPHMDHLMRLAYRFTDDAHRAEDLVQDVLVKLYPRQDELREVDKLRPWLARVMYRQFVDDIRRYSRSPVRLLGDEGQTEADPYSMYAADAPEPDTALEQDQDIRKIQRAWAQLNDEHRSVLGMHDVEGYTLQELVDVLEVPLGTLKSRLHRARSRLRELLRQIED